MPLVLTNFYNQTRIFCKKKRFHQFRKDHNRIFGALGVLLVRKTNKTVPFTGNWENGQVCLLDELNLVSELVFL